MQTTITFLFLVRFSKFKHHLIGNFLNFLNKKYKGTLGRPPKTGSVGDGETNNFFLGQTVYISDSDISGSLTHTPPGNKEDTM